MTNHSFNAKILEDIIANNSPDYLFIDPTCTSDVLSQPVVVRSRIDGRTYELRFKVRDTDTITFEDITVKEIE